MSTLHIVNKSPAQSGVLQSCLRLIAPGDCLLLIEDGVYAATSAQAEAWFGQLPDGVECLALLADVQARGLTSRLADGVPCVDDNGFVQRCADHQRSVSWF